jgi:hypothetical protein
MIAKSSLMRCRRIRWSFVRYWCKLLYTFLTWGWICDGGREEHYQGALNFWKVEEICMMERFDDGEDGLLVQGACGSSCCGLSSAQLVQWKEHTFWPVQATCVGLQWPTIDGLWSSGRSVILVTNSLMLIPLHFFSLSVTGILSCSESWTLGCLLKLCSL